MILDSEEQRALILQFINSAPVQGPMEQVLELAGKVSALREAVAGAGISSGLDASAEAYAER